MSTMSPAAAGAAAGPGAVPFSIASRTQGRFSALQASVSNLTAGGSFQPIQLAATGWVRYIELFVTATMAASAGGAVVAGDPPWNVISAVTLTDATGQPVYQPITGYNLYLLNKYLPAGNVNMNESPMAWNSDPHMGPEYAYSATATTGTAVFRLRLEFEQDQRTGYGSIPNLDSNASLQLKVDYSTAATIFAGTLTASTLALRVSQHYYAPVSSSMGGSPVNNMPIGAGDYLETRFETQVVSAASENLVSLTNRGGLLKGSLLVSRAAGVRTAITAASNFGVILDNVPIFEGIPIEEWHALVRRATGYLGADLTTSYAALTAGVLPGLDRGVIPLPWDIFQSNRDSWLNTRVGSLYQVRLTPGAAATTLEVVTQLAQVRDAGAFYDRGA